MDRDDSHRAESLLDFHLDQLSEHDRSRVEAELLRDAGLRAKSDRLGEILRPLDHWTVAAPPANLVDKILRTARESTDSVGGSAVPSTERSHFRRGPLGSYRELIAVAACIAFLVGVAIPGLSALRNRSHRSLCASHLGSIFRGTSLYRQSFEDALPFAGGLLGASWLPMGAAESPYQSNSRHIYLVAKLNYGPKPEDFICPAGDTGRPMKPEELVSYNDFARASNISYTSLNMAGEHPNLRPGMPIAYMSDPSPLFANGRFRPSVDANTTNSPAHGGRGQSVLIVDGSVRYLSTPFCGPRRDNLWLAGSIRRYRGTETPASHDDAFLIPGYPATDPLTHRRAVRSR